MRVLVVDDSSTMRRIIRNNLKAGGYDDVLEAENGESALMRLTTDPADVIVTDWNMPGMNGIEFVTKLRTLAAYAKTPVLMVTTMAEKENILEAMKAGVTNYVVKPFDAGTLKKKIEQILGG